MKTDIKTENSNNIHVFRVNRVTAKVKESSSQAIVHKVNSRTRLSAETKRSICEDHIKNPRTTQEALAIKYGCKRTTVAKIIKSKDRWLSIDSDDIIAKRFRQRNSRYPLVENSLKLWLQKEHNDISSVTDQMLRSQARLYAQEYHVDGVEEFKASSSWISNFRQRYMIPKVNVSENPAVSDNNVAMQSDIPNRPSVNLEMPVLPLTESSGFEAAASVESSTNIYSSNLTDLVAESINDLNSGEIDGDTEKDQSASPTMNGENDAPNDCDLLNANKAPNAHNENDEVDFMDVDIVRDVTKTSKAAKDSNMKNDGIMTEAVINNDRTDDEMMADCMEGEIDDNRDDYGDQDYGGDQDYDDGYSDIEQPCFADIENAEDIISTSLDIQKTATNVVQETKEESETVRTLKSNIEPDTPSHENTKEIAKQHLEAALAFYSSNNDGTNQSMSANMIKLILQSDF